MTIDRAILHDEGAYGPDVDSFNPERFLHPDGKLNESIPHPHAVFGFGRRVCAGQDLAEAAIWIALVSILSAFDVTKALDEEGNVIEPSGNFTSQWVS